MLRNLRFCQRENLPKFQVFHFLLTRTNSGWECLPYLPLKNFGGEPKQFVQHPRKRFRFASYAVYIEEEVDGFPCVGAKNLGQCLSDRLADQVVKTHTIHPLSPLGGSVGTASAPVGGVGWRVTNLRDLQPTNSAKTPMDTA